VTKKTASKKKSIRKKALDPNRELITDLLDQLKTKKIKNKKELKKKLIEKLSSREYDKALQSFLEPEKPWAGSSVALGDHVMYQGQAFIVTSLSDFEGAAIIRDFSVRPDHIVVEQRVPLEDLRIASSKVLRDLQKDQEAEVVVGSEELIQHHSDRIFGRKNDSNIKNYKWEKI